jgi:DNA invertase Pin-like site-specific DNA recombinase
VELVRRYSNRADLQERLAEARLRASQRRQQEPDSDAVTVGGRSPRVWRIQDRLADGDIEQLIAAFQAGTPKRVLAERYAISIGTVKNILRKHGVRRAY